MVHILDNFLRLIKPIQPLSAGIYHYQAPPDDPRNYRLHLRLEPDGSGILIVNAATVLHLNQTAAEYAYYLVQNLPAHEVARKMTSRYHVKTEQALQDYKDLADRLQVLINTPDLDPVTFLDFERQVPFSGHISAPYRLDCALTYRLPGDASPDAAPFERVKREMETQEWKTVLDKAWTAGIPHIIFTGGEPTLREDLPELIAHAEANGQVSGLLTDGMRLAEDDYRQKLLQTGLDHVLIVLQPEEEKAWEALQESLEEDLFIAVHLTLTAENRQQFSAYLERLAKTGIGEVSLSANSADLSSDLQKARNQAAALGLKLVWNLPAPYSKLNPFDLEPGGIDLPEGAGRAWLYVEPDGDVLPAQGVNQVLGNLLIDPWEKVWKRG